MGKDAKQSPCGRLRFVLLGVLMSVVCGCGSQTVETLLVSASYTVSCEGDPRFGQPATDRVVIDWTGGESDIVGGDSIPGVDYEAFALADGGTLEDVAAEFRRAVRDEVATILCSLPDAAVHVENGEGDHESGVTVIYVSQAMSSDTPGQIGEGDYDPCNVTHTNEGVIYGDELLELGGPYTFDEWVRMFANVIAHEVGHTIGYGHVERARYVQGERPLYTELMLAVHTVPEMTRSQRYLANDSNCPVEEDSATSRRVLQPGYTCTIEGN